MRYEGSQRNNRNSGDSRVRHDGPLRLLDGVPVPSRRCICRWMNRPGPTDSVGTLIALGSRIVKRFAGGNHH